MRKFDNINEKGRPYSGFRPVTRQGVECPVPMADALVGSWVESPFARPSGYIEVARNGDACVKIDVKEGRATMRIDGGVQLPLTCETLQDAICQAQTIIAWRDERAT